MIKFINKKTIPYILLILAIIYIFLQRSCNDNKISYNTKLIKQFDTIYKPSEIKTKIVTKYKTKKGDFIYLSGKIDTVEIKVFEKVEDSIKIKMFANSIKIRQYKNDFNDSIADVSIFTETKGELLKIAPKITVKARLSEKKTVFALYSGFETYNNLQFNNFGVKVNLMFQNKKGDLFTTGYDTNKNIYIGYNFRLINIKK